MKLQKIMLGAAVLSLGFTAAADVRISGYADFSSTLAAQQYKNSGDGEGFQDSKVMAEYGPFQNGIHFLNVDANVPYVDFHTGVWLGAGIGPWYGVDMYPDRTKDSDTGGVLLQMYLVTHFFGDQMRFYSGNFAGNGFTADYVISGFVSDQSHVSPLAMRGTSSANDSAFTGVEFLPKAISGLKFIAGLPIAPFTDAYEKFNDWNHLRKATKFMMSYNYAVYNVTVNAGIRPNTYGTNGARADNDYTTSLFGESFVQLDMPSLVYGVHFNASYDVRWRDVSVSAENTKSGEEWNKTAYAHMAVVSAKTTLVPNWTISVEDALGFYDSHYISINERALYNRLGLHAERPLAGTPYLFGFTGYFMYGQDANGSMMSRDADYCSDLVGYEWNFMAQGDLVTPKTGSNGRYLAGYVYPYFQKNFTNGKVSLGVELNYFHGETSNIVQNFSWRIPLGVAFWW